MRWYHAVCGLTLCSVTAACSADMPTSPVDPLGSTSAEADDTIPAAPYTLTLLPIPVDAYGGQVLDVNDHNVVVGWRFTFPDAPEEPMVWNGSAAGQVAAGTGMINEATLIANDGTVAGLINGSDGTLQQVVWRSDGMQVLGPYESLHVNAICACDGSTLAGLVRTADGDRAALWAGDFRIDIGAPPGADSTGFIGIGHGTAIGNASLEGSGTVAPFRWSHNDGWVRLADEGRVAAISNDGSVIVGEARVGGAMVPVWWHDGSTSPDPIPLHAELTSVTPVSVNDSGLVLARVKLAPPRDTLTAGATWSARDGWRLLVDPDGPRVTDVVKINDASAIIGEVDRVHSPGPVLHDRPALWTPVPD